MSYILDVQIYPVGIYITFFRILQFGVELSNTLLAFHFSFYRIGFHIHLVLEETNRCVETIVVKKP